MGEKPDVKRILLLDSDIEALPGKYDPGGFCRLETNRILDIVKESFKFWLLGLPIHDLGHDFYSSNPQLEEWIQEVTEKGSIDYVVIGNNLGAGIPKAAAVNPVLREDKACVVWNVLFKPKIELSDPTYQEYLREQTKEKKAYTELGYKHFLERRRLAEHLLNHFQWK